MTSFRNQSNLDRALRIALGLAMLGAGFAGLVPGIGGIALCIFGWYPLVTGLLGWSPVYTLLGIRTLRSRSRKA
jgi:hypothetical protein